MRTIKEDKDLFINTQSKALLVSDGFFNSYIIRCDSCKRLNRLYKYNDAKKELCNDCKKELVYMSYYTW